MEFYHCGLSMRNAGHYFGLVQCTAALNQATTITAVLMLPRLRQLISKVEAMLVCLEKNTPPFRGLLL